MLNLEKKWIEKISIPIKDIIPSSDRAFPFLSFIQQKSTVRSVYAIYFALEIIVNVKLKMLHTSTLNSSNFQINIGDRLWE